MNTQIDYTYEVAKLKFEIDYATSKMLNNVQDLRYLPYQLAEMKLKIDSWIECSNELINSNNKLFKE